MQRIDTLTNGYKIIQDDKAFCFGVDAVLLSAFTKLKPAQTIVDLGCGNGIISLLLHPKAQKLKSSHTTKKCSFIGIEIQEAAVQMAQKSVEMNGLQDNIKILNGDIKNIKNLMQGQNIDVVVSNPPYMLPSASIANSTDEKTIARHEVLCSLDDIIAAAFYLLKSNGSFFMIHRPYRLQEIFCALQKYHLTPRRMQFVYPTINASPEMVLIEARPNYKADLKIDAPLIMYGENGEYTDNFKEYCETNG